MEKVIINPKISVKTHLYNESEEAVQQLFVSLWKEVLELDHVGLDDDFFELGGTSYLSLMVYDRLRRHYRREFPLFDLSVSPTVRTLSKNVYEELGKHHHEFRCLRQIQAGKPDEIPLFLVHGGDGNARVFLRLKKNLDPKVPVYAFQWPGWDGSRSRTKLQDLAEIYVDELIRLKPPGVFRLGGYCIGGTIALEMYQALGDEQSRMVGPLLIWDTPNVRSTSYHSREPWYDEGNYSTYETLVEKVRTIRSASLGEDRPFVVVERFEGAHEFIYKHALLYNFLRNMQIGVVGVTIIQLMLLLRKSVPIKWRWRYCMIGSYLAQRTYRNRRKYDGDVVYFRSDCLMGRPMCMSGWWSDPFMGFGEFCTQPLSGHVVGGDHVSLLGETACADVVNLLYK